MNNKLLVFCLLSSTLAFAARTKSVVVSGEGRPAGTRVPAGARVPVRRKMVKTLRPPSNPLYVEGARERVLGDEAQAKPFQQILEESGAQPIMEGFEVLGFGDVLPGGDGFVAQAIMMAVHDGQGDSAEGLSCSNGLSQ